MPPRGTTRTPGADPTRLPLGLDPQALDIAEGIRAGLAAALPISLATILHQPTLALAALGALLTCIADPAGPIRRRLPLLAGFVVTGAILLAAFAVARTQGIAPTLALAAPALFLTSFVRIYGAPFAATGNLLAVVLLLGTDAPLTIPQALHQASLFAAGGAWALLLTLAFWRIYPYGPARRAVADVWDALAAQARMILTLLDPTPHTAGEWESLARASRGHVRNTMERARTILMETLQSRGPASAPAAQNLLRLEQADRIFGVLIALSDQLETAPAATRAAATAMLRRLRPLLRVIATATQTEAAAIRPDPATRLDRSIDAIQHAAASTPALHAAARALTEPLRAAITLIDPAGPLPGSTIRPGPGRTWRQIFAAPARANLTWASASLRHAARTALVTIAALGFTLVRHGPYTHWLTITLVLVMQPFFATTWQRSLERVAGTLLGGATAALLSTLVHSRLALAALLPLLGAAALAVRQVSYGIYIAVYTPVIILLVEQFHPDESQIHIALARAGYTIAGGLLAILANATLWPAWQPAQVATDLQTAITAHAAYARAVLNPGQTAGTDLDRARRAAGLASNNLEASLQRAMHEPRPGQRDRLQAVLVADATLRRIAGGLAARALHATPQPGPASPAPQNPMHIWLPDALQALAQSAPLPPRPQSPSPSQSQAPAQSQEAAALTRLARQVELLADVTGRAPA